MNFKELYPIEESPRVKFLISLILGVFIGLFLNIFQPFGLSIWEVPFKILKISFFGFITFGVCILRYFVYPLLFPSYYDGRNWTVGKEIWSLLITVLTTAVLNYAYLIWISPKLSFLPNFWEMILETLVIGIFPIAGIVISNYIYQLKKFTDLAGAFPVRNMVQKQEPVEPLVLLSENQAEKLDLSAKDLIFLESKSNYVEVNYLKEDSHQKKVLRSTLAGMEEQIKNQLKENLLILKCHRSFIVHMGKVSSIKGNAQGYRLQIRDSTLEVPVGRKFKDCIHVWKNLN